MAASASIRTLDKAFHFMLDLMKLQLCFCRRKKEGKESLLSSCVLRFARRLPLSHLPLSLHLVARGQRVEGGREDDGEVDGEDDGDDDDRSYGSLSTLKWGKASAFLLFSP